MRTVIFSFLIFTCSAIARSQELPSASREETESWILSKLRKYSTENLNFSDIVFENRTFDFDSCYFYVRRLAKNPKKGTEVYETFKMPLWNVWIDWDGSPKEMFDITLSTGPLKITEYSTANSSEVKMITRVVIPMDFYQEKDLFKRLRTAFYWLKTFCPDPHGKEKF